MDYRWRTPAYADLYHDHLSPDAFRLLDDDMHDFSHLYNVDATVAAPDDVDSRTDLGNLARAYNVMRFTEWYKPFKEADRKFNEGQKILFHEHLNRLRGMSDAMDEQIARQLDLERRS